MKYKSLLSIILNIILLSNIIAQTNYELIPSRFTKFMWINTEIVENPSFGAGYSMYSTVWPMMVNYPGYRSFQSGLVSSWLEPKPMNNSDHLSFYQTIEGGLGWWNDTRFGTKTPKFIMGAVAYNFSAWANGPGAGSSATIRNGYRDWSEDEGKYGAAQLSQNVLWPPDGLNMKQGSNGQLLGYGYLPLPLTDTMSETNGEAVSTGNQSWTLFLNSENFKGPLTFILPTFWSKAAVENPHLESHFFDARPSNQNVGFGIEHADSPALISYYNSGDAYAKVSRRSFPKNTDNNYSLLNHQIKVYSKEALWNKIDAWFNGNAEAVIPSLDTFLEEQGTMDVVYATPYIQEEIITHDDHHPSIPTLIESNIYNIPNVGEENHVGINLIDSYVSETEDSYLLPEYYQLNVNDNTWVPIGEQNVPYSTNLLDQELQSHPINNNIPYLTPLDPENHKYDDPDNPWRSPGPTAGPFYALLGDGSRVTYYWYKFINQPSIVRANLPNDQLQKLQERIELIHTHWKSDQEYLEPPSTGKLVSLDPNLIVKPPLGLEIGYVPIVSRQEKMIPPNKLRIFILAGQSNMQGHGWVRKEWAPEAIGTLIDVLDKDSTNHWEKVGSEDDWKTLDNVWIYSERDTDTLSAKVSVDQGTGYDQIGPELMFAHEIDSLFGEDPILIIKTAWGGKSLAVDFRPPSASGNTGEYYTKIIETVEKITDNLGIFFPSFDGIEYEYSGFGWFQGWNDGESLDFAQEYENNLSLLLADIRKDLDSPNLPIVIANSGHYGDNRNHGDTWVHTIQDNIVPAQEAVACDFTYEGNVGYVDTRAYYYAADQSPDDALHHFNNNALSYLHIGQKMGFSMIKAVAGNAFCNDGLNSEDIRPNVPSFINLSQNYPNPFNPNTVISFSLTTNSSVELSIYDIMGKKVATLVNEFKNAGMYEVNFNASDLSSGMYMYQLKIDGKVVETRSMTLIK